MTFDERDVLRKAAERVVEPGRWTPYYKPYFQPSDQDGCAVQIIGDVAEELDGDRNRLGQKAVIRLVGLIGGSLGPWNDAPGRTADEVAQAMREAADLP